MENRQFAAQTFAAQLSSKTESLSFGTLVTPRGQTGVFGCRSGSPKVRWQDPAKQWLPESGIPRVNARKIIPNPVVATSRKRRQVSLPKTIRMKGPAIGTFADSSTGIDEELMHKGTLRSVANEQSHQSYLQEQGNGSGYADYLKQALDGGAIVYAAASPGTRGSTKGSTKQGRAIQTALNDLVAGVQDPQPHVPHTPSQNSSAMQFSPPQTPSYGLGMFALKKNSMLTKRNLLQKLDNDFQAPNVFTTELQGSKLNVDLCLGLTYSPRLKSISLKQAKQTKPHLTQLTKDNLNGLNKASNQDLENELKTSSRAPAINERVAKDGNSGLNLIQQLQVHEEEDNASYTGKWPADKSMKSQKYAERTATPSEGPEELSPMLQNQPKIFQPKYPNHKYLSSRGSSKPSKRGSSPNQPVFISDRPAPPRPETVALGSTAQPSQLHTARQSVILQYDPKTQSEQQRASNSINSPQPGLNLESEAGKKPVVAELSAEAPKEMWQNRGLPPIDEMNSKQTLADNGFSFVQSLAVSVEEFLDANLQNIDKQSEPEATLAPEAAHATVRGTDKAEQFESPEQLLEVPGGIGRDPQKNRAGRNQSMSVSSINNNSFRNPKINEAFTRSSRAGELMSSDEPNEVKRLEQKEQEEINLEIIPAHLQMKIVPASKNIRNASVQPKSPLSSSHVKHILEKEEPSNQPRKDTLYQAPGQNTVDDEKPKSMVAAKNIGHVKAEASVFPCSPTMPRPKAQRAAAAGALASMQSAMHSSGGPLLEHALRPTYEHSVVAPPPHTPPNTTIQPSIISACEMEMVRNGTSATEIGQEGYYPPTHYPEEAQLDPDQNCLNKVAGILELDQTANADENRLIKLQEALKYPAVDKEGDGQFFDRKKAQTAGQKRQISNQLRVIDQQRGLRAKEMSLVNANINNNKNALNPNDTLTMHGSSLHINRAAPEGPSSALGQHEREQCPSLRQLNSRGDGAVNERQITELDTEDTKSQPQEMGTQINLQEAAVNQTHVIKITHKENQVLPASTADGATKYRGASKIGRINIEGVSINMAYQTFQTSQYKPNGAYARDHGLFGVGADCFEGYQMRKRRGSLKFGNRAQARHSPRHTPSASNQDKESLLGQNNADDERTRIQKMLDDQLATRVLVPNLKLPTGRMNAQYYRFNKQASPRILPSQAKINQIDFVMLKAQDKARRKDERRSVSTVYERLRQMNLSTTLPPLLSPIAVPAHPSPAAKLSALASSLPNKRKVISIRQMQLKMTSDLGAGHIAPSTAKAGRSPILLQSVAETFAQKTGTPLDPCCSPKTADGKIKIVKNSGARGTRY